VALPPFGAERGTPAKHRYAAFATLCCALRRASLAHPSGGCWLARTWLGSAPFGSPLRVLCKRQNNRITCYAVQGEQTGDNADMAQARATLRDEPRTAPLPRTPRFCHLLLRTAACALLRACKRVRAARLTGWRRLCSSSASGAELLGSAGAYFRLPYPPCSLSLRGAQRARWRSAASRYFATTPQRICLAPAISRQNSVFRGAFRAPARGSALSCSYSACGRDMTLFSPLDLFCASRLAFHACWFSTWLGCNNAAFAACGQFSPGEHRAT